jgi:hypothetical protein
MKTLNDILTKLKFDKEYNLVDAHYEIIELLKVDGWLDYESNKRLFGEYSRANCLCKFDDGTICRYDDEHPIAVLTHFKLD